ncbi:uncharacterized protein LOC105835697 [Monomorium pharaonis]|uniref:uncharacterized protein LOC105835697 n=1 Tax=Monomorium pharaonis TaxID=307658 RepID=UPI00063F32BF|nr:uncharacterized protein LOC105835697 [Monomorium pharaonis]
MDMEVLKCNLFDTFQKDDHSVLDKWISSCREFRSYVDTKVEQGFFYEKDCSKKKSVNIEKISELQQEINKTKSDIDTVILQQKLTDRKISNTIKLQKDLKDDLEKARLQRETLILEIEDLKLQQEERKTKKILQWDAIKRASNIYKVNLDVHLTLEQENDQSYIKISFFTHNDETKDKYFVQLSCSDNNWKVEQIKPKLRKEHLEKISSINDSSSKVSDITLFLCQVRSIFLQHYM